MTATAVSIVRPPTWIERALRQRVLSHLERLPGRVLLEDGEGSVLLGAGEEAPVSWCVHDPAAYRRIGWRGTLGFAEGYMAGEWTSNDLAQLLAVLARDPSCSVGVDRRWGPWLGLCSVAWRHAWRHNSRRGSRANIAEHYDLGNAFYELWLDPSLTYSSALFAAPDTPLAAAQEAKLDRICRKLALSPADHVLEIGTGWGSFALHAAGRYGCRVTTLTISREQHALATRRVAAAGLTDLVAVRLEDYRDARGQFDKLVSIEMIEAVGHHYLDEFFRVCSDRLRPHGAMLLQAITLPEQGWDRHRRSRDFVQRYIFPGSFLPSIAAMMGCVARVTDLRLTHVEEITAHYARTLAHWRRAFLAAEPEVRALGFDDRFLRMWEYYLAYCEAGFATRMTGNHQLLLVKPRSTIGLDPTFGTASAPK